MKTLYAFASRGGAALLAWLVRPQVSAAFIALVCVFLISINVRHASAAREAAISSQQQALLSMAQSVAGHAGIAFSAADAVARDIALDFEIFGTDPARIRQLEIGRQRRQQDMRPISNVIAFDDHGKAMFHLQESPEVDATATQVAALAFFRFHHDERTARPHVSRPVQITAGSPWVVPVSRRFDRPDGSFGGVVVAFINWGYFQFYHRNLDIGATDTAGLFFDARPGPPVDGQPDPEGARTSLDPRIATQMLQLAATRNALGTGMVGNDDRDGRLFAVARVVPFGQTAVVTRSLSATLGAWDANTRVAAQTVAATTVLLTFLMLALFQQVRSRRAAEGAMQQKDTQFGLMLDGVEDYGIFMLDTDGRILTWNVGAERVTGFAADEAIGRDSDFFSIPEDRTAGYARRTLAHALRSGREENDSWRIRRDGARFLVHTVTTPLLDPDGRHYGFLKVMHDITAARKTEEALQASEFRWKYALQGAGEGVWDIDAVTRVAEVSAAYLHMLGHTGVGARITEVEWAASVHPDDLPHARKAYLDHCKGLAPNYAAEYRVRCADGSWKWVLSRGMVVNRDAGGRALRVIGTHTDISHMKSIEERLHQQNALMMEKNLELEQASRVKSEFLANMSHELRTPLNAVLGFTGTILMELPGPLNAEQKKQLEVVRDSGRHLLALINEILDLAKIESGSTELTITPVACQTLIADVIRSLMPLASQKQIGLDLTMPPEPIEVVTDARLLKQILINLVGNAVKFTESGGVTVALRREAPDAADAADEASVWIDVEDTGIGIRAEDIDKLFLPFMQIEAGLSRRFEGTGLGLNVSKKYAEMLGASLHVQSRFGQGSKFSICLPVQVAVAARREAAPVAVPARGTLNMAAAATSK